MFSKKGMKAESATPQDTGTWGIYRQEISIYLRDTCLLMQDDFKAVLDYFGIEYADFPDN